ncbi:MAG TPA: DUF6379 domain-containing protein [Flavisolibacter sp.]|nr:DUF6379 domain-containing protein [Flavisolibacter sp.]
MGPLDKYILPDDGLQTTNTGFTLQFHSHWYRSLPLSCMHCKAFIDEQEVEEKNIEIEVNGNRYPFVQMPNLIEEWLFITEAATLHVKGIKPLQRGREYSVRFKLDLFIPYILVGKEGTPLLASSTIIKKLTCN